MAQQPSPRILATLNTPQRIVQIRLYHPQTKRLHELRSTVNAPHATSENAWAAFVQIMNDAEIVKRLHGPADIKPLLDLLLDTPDPQTKADRIKTVIDELHASGGQLKVNTHTYYIQALGEQITYEMANDILDEKAARHITPNAHTFSAILQNLVDRHDQQGVVLICKRITSQVSQSNLILVTISLKAILAFQSLSVADNCFDDLWESQGKLNSNPYLVMMVAHAKEGDVE
ncbi:hypothetical protein HDV00_009612 [Rhizophlyctis rosea]|nr:hypothetical protein HDV00_009612 [Rhizophlyctis rosea]